MMKKYFQKDLVLISLSILLIYMVLGNGNKSFFNASFIFNLESTFILLYFFTLKRNILFSKSLKKYTSTFFLLALWSLSVVYSFYTSPLYTIQNELAYSRLIQSFIHVIFFISVWHYFKHTQVKTQYLFYSIIISTLILAGYFIYYIHHNTWLSASYWFENPPMNAHVRHTGYQVMATLAFFLAFILPQKNKPLHYIIQFSILSILFTFLFWLGGRGTVVSLLATFIFLFIVLIYKKVNYRKFILLILASSIIGLFLSDLLSFYPWNGLLGSLQRSLEAESINQLSTNRIALWESTISSLKGNLLFGLGPQSYYLMPNRIFGVHPHNVILQFLIEWGVVGTLLFLSLLLKVFYTGIKLHIINKAPEVNNYALAAGAVIFTLTVNALIDGTYYHPQPCVYLAISFAIWITPSRTKDILDK